MRRFRFSTFFRSIFPLAAVAVLLATVATPSYGQRAGVAVDESLYKGMKWRNIGPFRGGRATTVAGSADQPHTFYMGATGGGVWKTEDAGHTWKNVSDGYMGTGSVGAIAVAPSDANVVYVGMGESPFRGVMSSHGDGVYKSVDAGRTWTNMGLGKIRQTSAVAVHPENPDLVYVGAQGSPWAATPDRGVYRSRDGGKTWKKVLYVDENTGVSALSMDASNPRILYASMWDHRRKPWKVTTAGPGGGIHKSEDGGDTWKKLEGGLPSFIGKSGVAASPARPGRVWALIEAGEDGGLFRSEDWGKTWKRINTDRTLQTRAWYYIHIFADPQDPETVYVLGQLMMRSTDGGFSFVNVPTPHGDNHGLWINPGDNQLMVEANDGGANVSFNGGKTWSTQANQPTAQFYRVNTDNLFPYRLYGGQQDNSTVSIPSRSFGRGIGREHWSASGGGESAHVSFDPDDPTLIYAGSFLGNITEFDRSTGKVRSIMAYPAWSVFRQARDHKYRFNWNAPIVVSKHDTSVIYHAAQLVLKSTDRGQSWQEISPDLSRNEDAKQGHWSGPFSLEVAGPDNYNTILYLAESPYAAGTLWAGTDDGLVHLTRDEGKTWTNVTPKGIGEAEINAIEISPHDPATAYLAVNRHKFNDFRPLIYRTSDYGKSWRRIVNGIKDQDFVRVVREDPVRKGLLYAGTVTGVYVSFNNGGRWQSLQLKLPALPVTDLMVRQNDLVAATQGRGFWILDDLSPLQQITADMAKGGPHLFKPRAAIRAVQSTRSGGPGTNPPNGAIIYYYLDEASADGKAKAKLEILDQAGGVIRTFKIRKDDKIDAPPLRVPFVRRAYKFKPPTTEAGLNRFAWDLRREQFTRTKMLFRYSSQAPERVIPGAYQVRLTVGDNSQTQPLQVLPDPNRPATEESYQEMAAYLARIHDRINDINGSVNRLQSVRKQVKDRLEFVKEGEAEAVTAAGKKLMADLELWEDHIRQPPVSEGRKDTVNFPTRLLTTQYAQLKTLVESADPPITEGAKLRLADLEEEWAALQAEREQLLGEAVPAFNATLEAAGVPAVMIPAD